MYTLRNVKGRGVEQDSSANRTLDTRTNLAPDRSPTRPFFCRLFTEARGKWVFREALTARQTGPIAHELFR